MAFIKLDTIIKQLCRRTGEPEYRNYDDILEHVVSCCRQLNLLAIPTVTYKKVELNAYNAINWPLDCVKPIMIGLIRCGKLVTLSLDESISPGNLNTNCSNLNDAECEIDQITSNGYDSEYSLALGDGLEFRSIGKGYNHVGYISHDKQNRQSHVRGRYKEGDEFIMVFKSDGVSCGMEMVPSETEMCIKSFALREYYTVKSPGVSRSQDYRYKEEFTALKKLYSAITADDWSDLFMSL